MAVDGDIFKVVVLIDLPTTVIAQNVYAWKLSDPTAEEPTNAAILAVLDSKITAMYTDIASQVSDAVLFDDIEVDRVEWNAVDKFWETVESLGQEAIAVAGTNVDDAMPHGVAATVTGYTTWPKTRARKFFPGIAEGAAEDSIWDGATLTALAALITEWLTNKQVGVASELVPVVLSASGTKEGQALSLIAAAANSIAGYQRRRKPGVGS